MAGREPYQSSVRGLGLPLSEEEQMMLRPTTPLDRVIPWVDRVPDLAPSSLRSVQPFLHTATRFHAETPRVAFLCRSHALALANKIDPASVCPGVAKFKTHLSSRLKEDSTPSLQKRVKNTDVEELWSFILQYYDKDIRAADPRQPNHAPNFWAASNFCAAKRFAGVLLDVLSALSRGFEDIAFDVGLFLRTAARFQGESPRVAFLCRSHALALANKIDPASVRPSVAKFKTDLSSRLKEDSTPSLQKRVKKTDVEELWSFILHYYNKDIRAADPRQPDYESNFCAAKRCTAVLLEVLSPLSRGFEDIGVEDDLVCQRIIEKENALKQETAVADQGAFGGLSGREDKRKFISEGFRATASHRKSNSYLRASELLPHTEKASRSSFLEQGWKFLPWNLFSNGTSKEGMGGEGAKGAESQRGSKNDLLEYEVVEEEFFECSSNFHDLLSG